MIVWRDSPRRSQPGTLAAFLLLGLALGWLCASLALLHAEKREEALRLEGAFLRGRLEESRRSADRGPPPASPAAGLVGGGPGSVPRPACPLCGGPEERRPR